MTISKKISELPITTTAVGARLLSVIGGVNKQLPFETILTDSKKTGSTPILTYVGTTPVLNVGFVNSHVRCTSVGPITLSIPMDTSFMGIGQEVSLIGTQGIINIMGDLSVIINKPSDAFARSRVAGSRIVLLKVAQYEFDLYGDLG